MKPGLDRRRIILPEKQIVRPADIRCIIHAGRFDRMYQKDSMDPTLLPQANTDPVGRAMDFGSGTGCDWGTATDAERLELRTNVLNGKPGFYFNGSATGALTHYLSQRGTLSSASPISIVAVLSMDAVPVDSSSNWNFQTLLAGDSGCLNLSWENVAQGFGSAFLGTRQDTETLFESPSNWRASGYEAKPLTVIVTYDPKNPDAAGITGKIEVNGVVHLTTTVTNATSGNYTKLGGNGAGSNFKGFLHYLGIFGDPLTERKKQMFRKLCARDWGHVRA